MSKKETSTQAKREAFLAALPALGWEGPDRFGHYHAKVKGPQSGTEHRFRLKSQRTSWRIERSVIIPATSYSKAAKQWVSIGRHGYFCKTDPAEHAQVPRFKQPVSPTPPTTPNTDEPQA